MVVSPQDFENIADKVENNHSSEISRRCSISRKYYSCFHYVRSNGDADPQSDFSYGGRGNDHKEAQKFLKKKGANKLDKKLFRLHKWRKDADYELSKTITESDIQGFNRKFRSFMNQVRYVI